VGPRLHRFQPIALTSPQRELIISLTQKERQSLETIEKAKEQLEESRVYLERIQVSSKGPRREFKFIPAVMLSCGLAGVTTIGSTSFRARKRKEVAQPATYKGASI